MPVEQHSISFAEVCFMVGFWTLVISASYLLVWGVLRVASWLYDRRSWMRWFSL